MTQPEVIKLVMSELGRKSSKAKAKAARMNGLKGGRPKTNREKWLRELGWEDQKRGLPIEHFYELKGLSPDFRLNEHNRGAYEIGWRAAREEKTK